MNRVDIQRLLRHMDKVSVSKVDEGMIGSRLTIRNLQALSDKDYQKVLNKPLQGIRTYI